MNTPVFSGEQLTRFLATVSYGVLAEADRLKASAWKAPIDPDMPEMPDLTDDDVAARLAASVALGIPALDWSALTMESAPATVREVNRETSTPSHVNTVNVRGIQIRATVPFIGDVRLLTLTPTEHFIGGFDRSVSARAASRNTGFVGVIMQGRHFQADAVAAKLDKIALDVERCLDYARADLALWETRLSDRLIETVTNRRLYLTELADLEAALNPTPPGDDDEDSDDEE